MTVENNAFKLLVISFLMIFALGFSRLAFAQNGVDNGQPLNVPEEPGVGPIVERSEGASDAEAGMAFNAVNFWLLLPLVAIPLLLYLAWPKRRHSSMDLSTGYAGVKGGKASQEEDLEDDDLF